MLHEKIKDAADKAEAAGVKKVDDKLRNLMKLLAGDERQPIDVEKVRAEFRPGDDLGTADGGPLKTPAAGHEVGKPGPIKSAKVSFGKPIQFIHFGYVHPDVARSFHSTIIVDDTVILEPAVKPGRAVYYRAAVEREAVFLGALARSVSTALADREREEGNLGTLMKKAADVLGGAPGTAGTASSADMKPFVEKIGKAWDAINKPEIAYADLHDAGKKLHEVRAKLSGYLLEQLAKAPPLEKPAAAGVLSNLPLVGDLPLPGELGSVVGMFRDVGGKLHDVQNKMIFGLTAAMTPAIEEACHRISLETIKGAKSPLYPVWFEPKKKQDDQGAKSPPIANMQMNDPFGDDLKKVKALRDANAAVQDATSSANTAVNKATKEPLEIIDFLSRGGKPAPGVTFLDHAFQAATGQTGALGGSEKLGEVATAAFYASVAESVPGFMTGFVETVVGYVFAVCVEFLRSVYKELASLEEDQTVRTEELVAAGSVHLLAHLVDFVHAKLGLSDLLRKISVKIPKLPRDIAGINWQGKEISAEPIAVELEKMLVEKAAPFLAPVVDYAMNGLALRLNTQRGWAAGSALTMEAHLGQLPTELALLFRNLFNPLWRFLTETCMSIVSDVVGKALGPAGDALGIAGDKLGVVTGFIDDARKKAKQLEDHAKKVEKMASDFVKMFENVEVKNGNTDQLEAIGAAAEKLKDKATSNPFADDGGGENGGGKNNNNKNKPGAGFPSDRVAAGMGKEILDPELAKVVPVEVKPAAAQSKANGGAS